MGEKQSQVEQRGEAASYEMIDLLAGNYMHGVWGGGSQSIPFCFYMFGHMV